MKRVVKPVNSRIISEQLSYQEGNSVNNREISKVLFEEQKGFCAYTEEYMGRADAKDIEHFNPQLKGTAADNYNNWFLVKHLWNKEKASKWNDFQPVLHPTAADFEQRIVYDGGDYRLANDNDEEAKNLMNLIKLDDQVLADERKKYIKRKKEEIIKYGSDAETFFNDLIDVSMKSISYLRAIEEEFGISIFELLEKRDRRE